MNTIRKQVLIALTVFGLAGTTVGASAANTPAPAAAAVQDQAQGRGHGQWAERAAARREQLHTALRLTPSQESAWNNYLAANPRHDGAPRPERGAWKTMSAPQRLETQIARARQHTERMEARLAALQPLYASFTPEQKKLFDEQGMGRGHGGRRGGHHGMQHKGA
jgi:protein CpxP